MWAKNNKKVHFLSDPTLKKKKKETSWGCNTAVTRFERGVEGSYPPNLDVLKV